MRDRAARLRVAYWPLAVLTVAYPLWWLLGVAAFMPALVALFMLVQLRRKSPLTLPSGFGWWAAFLVWVVLSVFLLSSDAPGAVPDSVDAGRVMVWAYGLAMYVSCTVAMVWMVNLDRRELPIATFARLLGWMYVWASIGGLVGLLLPHLELTSLLESLLPRSLANNSFVRSLIHPSVADIQTVLGRAEARPKAPFPYANTWGSVIALTLPFLIIGWIRHGAKWQRIAAPIVIAASAAPIVYSLNRGLWACLALGVLFTVIALARRGRYTALVVALVIVAVAAIAVLASPLGTLVGERFDNQHSNDRREQLMIQTVGATVRGSPILGYGGTRDVQGSFASIAGGATAECPACGVPPLGTQGHIWMVIFTQGIIGSIFFLVFLGKALISSLRGSTLASHIGSLILLFFGVQMLVYDTLGLPLMIVLMSVGLAWRAAPVHPGTTQGLLTPLLRRRRRIALATALGLAGGLALAHVPSSQYVTTNFVLLSDTPSYLPVELAASEPRRITIDTEAALVVAEQTLARVGGSPDQQADLRARLRISAIPTTQILVISLSGDSPTGLADTLDTVTNAYLETRRGYLQERQNQVIAVLHERLAELRELGRTSGAAGSAVLTALDDNLLTPTQAGEVIRGEPASQVARDLPKYAASGAALGLLFGTVLALRPWRRTSWSNARR